MHYLFALHKSFSSSLVTLILQVRKLESLRIMLKCKRHDSEGSELNAGPSAYHRRIIKTGRHRKVFVVDDCF